ncbi:MAG: BamA/TamA family outer membrane protein [Myxococcota bacterium]
MSKCDAVGMSGRFLLCVVLLASLATACRRNPARMPGETDIIVKSVTLRSKDGTRLTPPTGDFLQRLGMRKKSFLFADRTYSEFREAEDRRRIVAYWHTYGFFEVEVDPPEVTPTDDGKVEIEWRVDEGPRYRIIDVDLKHAPPEFEADLREMIYFGPGYEEVNLETMRKVRVTMQEFLRAEGYGHAVVYSRTWVDPDTQGVHWRYLADPGPKTRVGKITVVGNVKVPDEVVIDRMGLEPGDPYENDVREEREFDLLDSGAFASAFIRPLPTPRFLVPGDAPNDGGKIAPEQIDAKGELVPRDLPEEMDLKIHIVEAPSQQLRLRAGVEFDPTRIDTAVGGSLWLRNLFGPFHHLSLDGRVGYGWLWRGDTDDPTGLYGDVTLRYTKAAALGRLVDFRLTARYRDDLYPGFNLREFTTGPGLRAKLAPHLFFDLDALFRWGDQVGFGPFTDDEREAFHLADDDVFLGGELQASLILDERDNPVEAMEGYMLGARSSFSPGGVDRWNRYLTVNPLARVFVPLTRLETGPDWSLALRAEADFAFLDDQGIPLGPRVFSGGAYRFRGAGRHRLSPQFSRPLRCDDPADPDTCDDLFVGGRSVFEGSAEFRYLPPLKPYGVVFFSDVGAANEELNPFDDGVSLALGLGLRLRFWYMPIALDFSYRLLRDNDVQAPGDDPFLVFFRIGEAF